MDNAFKVVFKDELFQIFAHVAQAFGFRMSVLDVRGKETAPLRAQPISAYCEMVQTTLGGLGECQENDRRQCARARDSRRTVKYICHAGLREAVYPLFAEDQLIGYIVVGQFRAGESLPGKILARCDGPETAAALVSAYEGLPVCDPQRLESIFDIIEITTRYIMDHRILSVRQNLLADRILEFLTSDFASNPSVGEAAAHVSMSVSAVNHALRQVTGKSYKRLSNRLRVEKASELLLAEPRLTIAELAARVGIADPFYFSRLFKAQMGLSPQRYRRESANGSPRPPSALSVPPHRGRSS